MNEKTFHVPVLENLSLLKQQNPGDIFGEIQIKEQKTQNGQNYLSKGVQIWRFKSYCKATVSNSRLCSTNIIGMQNNEEERRHGINQTFMGN